MTPRMVVGIFVIAVENTPTDRAAGQQQLDEMLQKHRPRRPPPPLPAMSLGACRCCCRGGTLANGWRRPGPQPPEGEFRHRSLVPDEMVREVSEDGWGGRRQDPMAVRLVPFGVGSLRISFPRRCAKGAPPMELGGTGLGLQSSASVQPVLSLESGFGAGEG